VFRHRKVATATPAGVFQDLPISVTRLANYLRRDIIGAQDIYTGIIIPES
jgi:hypothetical protein